MTLTNPATFPPVSGSRVTPVPRPILSSVRPVSEGLVEVRVQGAVLGFVETVDPVFVALTGTRYDLAEEIAQSLTIHEAVAAVLRGSASQQ